MEISKNDPNPIVCYLIVRKDLNLSMGKTAAQVGHACSLLQKKIDFDLNHLSNLNNHYDKGSFIKTLKSDTYSDLEIKCNIYTKWLETGYRKVVLGASDKEFEKIKSEYPDAVIITDMGLTEIDPYTETVVGLFPNYKDQFTKTIKKLQTLK